MKKKYTVIIVALCIVSFVIGTRVSSTDDLDDLDRIDSTNAQVASSFDFELENNTIAPIKLTGGEETFFDIFFSYHDTLCAFKLQDSDVKKVIAKKAIYNNGKLVETSQLTSANLVYEGINKCFFSVHSTSIEGLVDVSLVTKKGKTINKVFDVETIQYEKRFNPLQISTIEVGKQYPVYVALNAISSELVVSMEDENIDTLLKNVIGNNSRKVANAHNVEIIYLEFQ